MRRVFTVLATLLVLVVVSQFFLAASGAFNTAPKDESFHPHRALGYGIVLIALLVTAAAALARMPGRIIGMSALIAVLGAVQPLIRAVSDAVGDMGEPSMANLVFGLHAVNGLVILGLAGGVAWLARTPDR